MSLFVAGVVWQHLVYYFVVSEIFISLCIFYVFSCVILFCDIQKNLVSFDSTIYVDHASLVFLCTSCISARCFDVFVLIHVLLLLALASFSRVIGEEP